LKSHYIPDQENVDFYGMCRFITVFIKSRHWTLFSAAWIKAILSTPDSSTIYSNVILQFMPRGFFLWHPPSVHGCHMLTHLILIGSITLIIFYEAYKLWSSSFWNILHSPIISFVSSALCKGKGKAIAVTGRGGP
jgi:hypothetical protein